MERQVLGEGELEDEAAPLAILGDVAEARVVPACAFEAVTSRPAIVDAAAARLAEAGEGVDELALAVPIDTGERDDLPRPHVEGDAAHGFEVTVVEAPEVLDAGGRARRDRSAASRP